MAIDTTDRWGIEMLQREQERAALLAWRKRMDTLSDEAAALPPTGPKRVTVTLDLDVTDLPDEMVAMLVEKQRESFQSNLDGWARGVEKERARLAREQWAHEWAVGSASFLNATLDTLRERLFDGSTWRSEHAEAGLARAGAWYHTGNRRRLHVHSVRVDEEHRGKGYGRKVMELVIRRAELEGYGLELRVDPDNTPAVRLYESLGFVHVPQAPTIRDSRGAACVLMVRK